MTINDPQNTTQNATDHEQHKTHLQPGWAQVLRNCKQFLLHLWHTLRYR
jgi:hypothetical protein